MSELRKRKGRSFQQLQNHTMWSPVSSTLGIPGGQVQKCFVFHLGCHILRLKWSERRQPELWRSQYHNALRTLEATEDVLLGITKPREHVPHCQVYGGWLHGRECSRAGWLWGRGPGLWVRWQEGRFLLSTRKSLLTSVGWAPLPSSEFPVGKSLTVESDDQPHIL